MNKLIEYLEENRIKFSALDEEVLWIGDPSNNFVLVRPNEERLLFDKEFNLITEELKETNYVFNFGGKWYYCDNPKKPQLNPLKYIGEAKVDFDSIPFLGIHGKYELMNGTRDYKYWCKKAKFLGIDILGICEKNTLAGTLAFQLSCLSNKIKPILGATYTINRDDYKYDIKCYVKNEKGWLNLLALNKECKIVNEGFIQERDFLKLTNGLVIVVDPKSIEYENLFPLDLGLDFYYQLDTVEYVNNDRDKWYLENLKKFVKSELEPIIITDAYYLDKEDSYIKKKLNLISSKIEYEAVNQHLKSIDEYIEELNELFNPDDERFVDLLEQGIKNTEKVASQCNYIIDTTQKHLPEYEMTEEENKKYKDKEGLFWGIIEDGLSKKRNIDEEKYIERIQKEVEIINHGKLRDYFLINYDQIRWCEDNNIMVGLGRGSAAGFLTSNLLNITRIDPFDYDLIAERFLTKQRAVNKIADIDIDHEQHRREEVKEYLRNRYGENQCCSVGTYTTLQLRGCLKELCRLENIPFEESNSVSKCVSKDSVDWQDLFKESTKNKKLKFFIQRHPNIINDIQLMIGSIKSDSIHASAFIITPKDKKVFEWMPARVEEKDGKKIYVSQWEGYDLEEAGFLKQDVLGLKTLDQIHQIFDSVDKIEGIKLDMGTIPLNDKKTFKFFSNGYNKNIFQFGADGLSEYTKQLKPSNINDIIATVALYRPGAIDNNFHNEYILLKNKEKEVEYMWGTEDITKNTYGLPVYQEQIMFICQKIGGFDLADTDEIRRGLGKKKLEVIEPYKEKFIKNAVINGCPENEAIDIWSMMEKFASYSFNLSHAAAYGIKGYITQWLKVNYPIHFWTTAFNFASEDDIAGYISEINKTGDIKVTPPDINKSGTTFTTDFIEQSINWSLISIKQCGDKAVEEIVNEREKGNYFSFEEFLSRHNFKGSKVNKAVIENLILSGVFDKLESLKRIQDRKKLIDFYRKEYKVKIDKTKDQFYTDRDYLDESWWWILRQKLLSGFAIFPYEALLEMAIEDKSYEIIDTSMFHDEESEGKKVKIGGYVQEVVEKSTKKGDYANLIIESNYEFIKVTVWSEEWESLRDLLEDSKKKVVLFSGVVNRYRGSNSLVLSSDSEVLVLE